MKQINLLVAAYMLTVAGAFANQTFNWVQQIQYIQYADEDGVAEFQRQEFDYDNEGRERGFKAYVDGALVLQYHDYQYNGRTVTFLFDFYSDGNVTSSSKFQKTYSDNNWIQATQTIQYAADGVAEAIRQIWDYDSDGRETGYKQYQNGALVLQYHDYQYNGRTVTFWSDSYSDGNVTSSVKMQRTYFDKNWVQMTQRITYAADGVVETQRIETDFDNEGREIGRKQYSNEALRSQNRDYQYNGQMVAFWMDFYSGGNVHSTNKIQIVYREPTGSSNVIETNNYPYLPNIVGYYSLSGVKLKEEPMSGVYIIVYDNGETKKIAR